MNNLVFFTIVLLFFFAEASDYHQDFDNLKDDYSDNHKVSHHKIGGHKQGHYDGHRKAGNRHEDHKHYEDHHQDNRNYNFVKRIYRQHNDGPNNYNYDKKYVNSFHKESYHHWGNSHPISYSAPPRIPVPPPPQVPVPPEPPIPLRLASAVYVSPISSPRSPRHSNRHSVPPKVFSGPPPPPPPPPPPHSHPPVGSSGPPFFRRRFDDDDYPRDSLFDEARFNQYFDGPHYGHYHYQQSISHHEPSSSYQKFHNFIKSLPSTHYGHHHPEHHHEDHYRPEHYQGNQDNDYDHSHDYDQEHHQHYQPKHYQHHHEHHEHHQDNIPLKNHQKRNHNSKSYEWSSSSSSSSSSSFERRFGHEKEFGNENGKPYKSERRWNDFVAKE